MSVKKSRVVVFIEFFNPQNLEILDSQIRELVKKNKFPAFRTMMIGCDYKGLRNINDDKIFKTPLMISSSETEDES